MAGGTGWPEISARAWVKLDFGPGRAAQGQGRELGARQVAVQGIADVGQHHRPQAESLDPVLEDLHVPGREHRRRQHIHLPAAAAGMTGFRHQHVDHGLHGQGIAGFQGAAVVGRIHRHHGHPGVLGVLFAEALHQAADVRPLGLRQARGG